MTTLKDAISAWVAGTDERFPMIPVPVDPAVAAQVMLAAAVRDTVYGPMGAEAAALFERTPLVPSPFAPPVLEPLGHSFTELTPAEIVQREVDEAAVRVRDNTYRPDSYNMRLSRRPPGAHSSYGSPPVRSQWEVIEGVPIRFDPAVPPDRVVTVEHRVYGDGPGTSHEFTVLDDIDAAVDMDTEPESIAADMDGAVLSPADFDRARELLQQRGQPPIEDLAELQRQFNEINTSMQTYAEQVVVPPPSFEEYQRQLLENYGTLVNQTAVPDPSMGTTTDRPDPTHMRVDPAGGRCICGYTSVFTSDMDMHIAAGDRWDAENRLADSQ